MTRYELTERLGAGAMAEIFRGKAVAAGGFEKPVAIKRILPHLSQDARFVEVLIAEANVVSHLRHRNIVQVFDVGMTPDGNHFIVLEFVDGCDLGKMQTALENLNRPLPEALGLYIASEVCDALEHAHRAPGPDGDPLRLVHRDVSPSNVLLSRSGEVKLTDFGIAKRTEEVTTHGGVRGKFAYISPEQASGRAVDGRSDVYSVGILMFELIVGQRLFSQLSDFDALNAVSRGEVPKPRSLNPKLDAKLEGILLKALALDPAHRYASAGELGSDLRSYRYSQPSTSGDPAAELATVVVGIADNSLVPALDADAAAEEFNDFTGGTNTFTLDDDESLVRKTSYAQAREKVEQEETRLARAFVAAGEPGSEDSDVFGVFSDDFGPEPEEDEEATRIVGPYLRASGAPQPAPSRPAQPSPQPAPRMEDAADTIATMPRDFDLPDNPALAMTMPAQPAGSSAAAAASASSSASPAAAAKPIADGPVGPPETLDISPEQARAVVDAVEQKIAADQAVAQGGAGAPAGSASAPASAPVATAAPAPSPVVMSAPPPRDSGTAPVQRQAERAGFPRWAVALFIVLLVGSILAGLLLSDGGERAKTPAAGAAAAEVTPAGEAADEAADADDADEVEAEAEAAAEGGDEGAEAAAVDAGADEDAEARAERRRLRREQRRARRRAREERRARDN
ncbi:serine/threonine-protein kinase [Haliangium ochraceum]|uniref:non-specific serine/threonine protein kinase n=1 Tax=Haliangium ochraceum (strain DSM 14365 / JCM 11303 / SMP-2) TaxID=502025 RepID=D0LK47_HALO1|nr:serine/threonine-protein kinase [Haliangium ochraceum]ACY13081.1 serine/threonine protein kinase [Haliangium ochraceum DSM 14365]